MPLIMGTIVYGHEGLGPLNLFLGKSFLGVSQEGLECVPGLSADCLALPCPPVTGEGPAQHLS